MRRCAVAIAAALALAGAPAAHGEQWIVQAGGNSLSYNPQVLVIKPGDTVTFRNLGGFHNVVANDGSFRCARGCDGDGEGGNGNASSAIWFATVAFPSAGAFGYFCEPHGAPGEGMYGTIIVEQPPPIPVPVGKSLLALLGAFLFGTLAWYRRRIKPGT